MVDPRLCFWLETLGERGVSPPGRRPNSGKTICAMILENAAAGKYVEALRAPQHGFLYTDGDNCIFMNPNNYEQIEVPRAALGKMEGFLQAGINLPVEFCQDKPISVTLPDVVEATRAETAPPQHSQQDSTLENGVQILVPLFVAPGELVRIDTRTESGWKERRGPESTPFARRFSAKGLKVFSLATWMPARPCCGTSLTPRSPSCNRMNGPAFVADRM